MADHRREGYAWVSQFAGDSERLLVRHARRFGIRNSQMRNLAMVEFCEVTSEFWDAVGAADRVRVAIRQTMRVWKPRAANDG